MNKSLKQLGSDQGAFANGDGGSTTYGDGLLVTGTFVAESTSFSFHVDSLGGGYQLNALLLHTPATATAIIIK